MKELKSLAAVEAAGLSPPVPDVARAVLHATVPRVRIPPCPPLFFRPGSAPAPAECGRTTPPVLPLGMRCNAASWHPYWSVVRRYTTRARRCRYA